LQNYWFLYFEQSRDDWIPDSDLPTPDDGLKMSAIEISEDEAPGPEELLF
jgi:hypothetical protein